MSVDMVISAAESEFANTAGLFQPGRLIMQDAWFAVARRSELKNKPLARMIYDTPVAIWSDAAGVVAAIEDRCCHRRAPLSKGQVVAGNLQCPYHGWVYNAAGQVIKVPSMGDDYKPQEQCRVQTYPVHVRYGFIWLWWGNPRAADPNLIPVVPFIGPDGKGEDEGTCFYDVPQELLLENVLDLTHIDFIHGGFLGDPISGPEEIEVEQTDETVTTIRTTKDRNTPAVLAPLFGFPKKQEVYNVTRVFVRSGIVISYIGYTPPGWGTFVFLSNIPESANHMRQEFAQVGVGPWWWRKLLPLSTGPIQRQDRRILELQYPRYAVDDGRLDMSAPIDGPTLRYRAIRRKIAKRQSQGDFSYAEGWQGSDAAKLLRVAKAGVSA